MTFEGQMRQLSDKFRLKLIKGGGGEISSGAGWGPNLWSPRKISRYAPVYMVNLVKPSLTLILNLLLKYHSLNNKGSIKYRKKK